MSKTPSREEALFAGALAQPPAVRGAFLAQACGADAALLARIAALIAAHDAPETLMPPSSPRPDMSANGGLAITEEKSGDAIGHYKLLQKIGEGGCGVVWMAEQEEPVRRRVALKVIKLGMDTKAVVARFEAERQALAMMDHPCIAKVHDAGSTDTGRPYFVMELVRGIPITKYCDENHLTPNHRLELFIKVCHAIQHAHQKGVIHRDIKPSNILVTVNDGAPTPKVIDFGIAKATQGKLTDATVFTAFEQFIGTPVYMSPEQAEMSSLDIDTRSDIYSLGVLLYELLTGRPPFDPKAFARAGVDQIRRQIREVEPPRPSVRLGTLDENERTTIARFRNTVVSQLSLVLRGDLDWIVMRCIEKDRTRRYDTANGLAIDIQRYLHNEPVTARPPSSAYLLQKLIRRNRIAFISGVAVCLALIAGAAVSTWQAARARRSEHFAAAARSNAEDLLGFFFTDHGAQLSDFGHIPVLQQVSDKAVIYYEGLPLNLQTRETRAGYAFALAGGGANLGWNSSIARWGEPRARERLDQAMRIFRELEATGPLSPFMRVAFAAASSGVAWQLFEEGRHLEVLPISQRGEEVVLPALRDATWARWAQCAVTNLIYINGISLHWACRFEDSLHNFERAIVSAEKADRMSEGSQRPGLRSAQIKVWCASPLWELGRRREACAMTAEADARLREFIAREPHLLSARWSLCLALYDSASQAAASWEFDRFRRALGESAIEYTELLKLQPRHTAYQFNLAVGFGSRCTHERMLGDFDAAEKTARRRVELLSADWSTSLWRGQLLAAHLEWARITAATGRHDETNEHLIAADHLQRRILDERGSGVQHQLFAAEAEAQRRQVERERLNWQAMRTNAELTIERLRRAELETAAPRRLAAARLIAQRDFVRAAFQMGDYAPARNTLENAMRHVPDRAGGEDIQQRSERLDDWLLRIHVLSRAGEKALGRAELEKIWPEVEDVFAAGMDYVFNRVQTARALSIRAEIDGDLAAKRNWLERAAALLRPADETGRLTRYEREVLLAGIVSQLASLGPSPTP